MQRRLRLHQTDDFERLKREGSAYRHAWLLLSVAVSAHPQNRYGIITSKQLGGAVVRNRVRRHLREAVHAMHPRLFQGHDFVLIARKTIVGQPLSAIQEVLFGLCQRAGLVIEEKPS